jgi:hypothetical protein
MCYKIDQLVLKYYTCDYCKEHKLLCKYMEYYFKNIKKMSLVKENVQKAGLLSPLVNPAYKEHSGRTIFVQ